MYIIGTGLIEAKRHPSKLPNFLPMLSKPIEEGMNFTLSTRVYGVSTSSFFSKGLVFFL